MLISRSGNRPQKSAETICMYRASTTRSTSPMSSSARASAAALVSGVTGTWWNGSPCARATGSRSGWLETTAAISARRSPEPTR